jgi:hypothetical protein
VKKAVLAAAVAAAAVGGVIAAIVLSSGSGKSASPPPQQTFLVGVVDDSLAQASPSLTQARVDASRAAGFDAVVVSSTWQRGERQPPAPVVEVLRNVGRATTKDKLQLFVMVWHGLARDTPQTPAERSDFAAYAAALVRAVPAVQDVIVGNEPNLSTFWKPQFGPGGRDVAAAAYADLLARTYDAIKDADPQIRVLGGAPSPRGGDRPGGSRPTHSPTAFIRDLGAAYRASGRNRPLMDAFAFHPYMQASRFPPTETHQQNTSITIADYPKLVALLGQAFDGTAQPGMRLPIYYTEFGVQTRVPPSKLRFYQDAGSPAATDAVSLARQAAYYRKALELAHCQRTVRGLFIFHTYDEPSLIGWQSGLYFVDGSPKPSLPLFRRAVDDLREGKFPPCPQPSSR